MEIRCSDHVTPLYPQKLTLTSPAGGGHSVGIVRSRTKATEFSLVNIIKEIYISAFSVTATVGKKTRKKNLYFCRYYISIIALKLFLHYKAELVNAYLEKKKKIFCLT